MGKDRYLNERVNTDRYMQYSKHACVGQDSENAIKDILTLLYTQSMFTHSFRYLSTHSLHARLARSKDAYSYKCIGSDTTRTPFYRKMHGCMQQILDPFRDPTHQKRLIYSADNHAPRVAPAAGSFLSC